MISRVFPVQRFTAAEIVKPNFNILYKLVSLYFVEYKCEWNLYTRPLIKKKKLSIYFI